MVAHDAFSRIKFLSIDYDTPLLYHDLQWLTEEHLEFNFQLLQPTS